jgi:hypothetical protein
MINDTVAQTTYDFAGKDPNAVLTSEELAHFDEGMSFKNTSSPAHEIDFPRAARSVAEDLDNLLP